MHPVQDRAKARSGAALFFLGTPDLEENLSWVNYYIEKINNMVLKISKKRIFFIPTIKNNKTGISLINVKL